MTHHQPDKKDTFIALAIGLLGLAAYLRTLAPDVLYADSAEFQTLAYTLGVSHTTGYPTYLLLGRLIGFLPIGSPAWRINLLSAVCAAFTLAGVYLLARRFTRNRIGPILGSLSLGISYTFWSQSVIAEVYTPGMAFLIAVLLLLFHWHGDPTARRRSLFFAALLAGIGFGVHASVWLIAPSAAAFVLWTLLIGRPTDTQRISGWRWAGIRSSSDSPPLERQSPRINRWRWPGIRSSSDSPPLEPQTPRLNRRRWLDIRLSVAYPLTGALIGLALFVGAFLLTDWINPPSSFMRVMLYPSRVFWHLQPGDLDSPFERMWLTVSGVQWRDAMFPGGEDFLWKEAEKFWDRLSATEFPPMVLLLAGIGLATMIATRPALGAFMPVFFLSSLYFILNYQPGDKHLFYLPTYLPLMVSAGVGMGFLLSLARRQLDKMEDRRYRWLYLLPVLFFSAAVLQPSAAPRWQALRAGAATFVKEDYPFPVENLKEPRFVAEMHLSGIPDNAVMVLEWRTLYTTIYVAQVERGKNEMLFYEAMPYGNDGRMASTLISELTNHLLAGRPVFVGEKYPGLEEHFRFLPAGASGLYRLEIGR